MASDERVLVSSTFSSTTGAATTGVTGATTTATGAATSVLTLFLEEDFFVDSEATGAREAEVATTGAGVELVVCLALVVRTILSSGRFYTLY